MAVSDVDAHFEPARDWLDQFPKLRDRLPAQLPDDEMEFAPSTADPEDRPADFDLGGHSQ